MGSTTHIILQKYLVVILKCSITAVNIRPIHSKWKQDLDSLFLQPTVLVCRQDCYSFPFKMIKGTAKFVSFYDYKMMQVQEYPLISNRFYIFFWMLTSGVCHSHFCCMSFPSLQNKYCNTQFVTAISLSFHRKAYLLLLLPAD